jgi:hypothetical protein
MVGSGAGNLVASGLGDKAEIRVGSDVGVRVVVSVRIVSCVEVSVGILANWVDGLQPWAKKSRNRSRVINCLKLEFVKCLLE